MKAEEREWFKMEEKKKKLFSVILRYDWINIPLLNMLIGV